MMIPPSEQALLEDLNHQLEELFQTLENYTPEQLNRQPDPKTWSPLMVAKHMMMAEGYAIGYVDKKLSFDPKLSRSGFKTGIRSWLLHAYLTSSLKWKAPKAISGRALQGTLQLSEIEQQWRGHRARLQKLLEKLPSHRYREAVYKHPFAGRLSIMGMLRFFKDHFERHCKQIEGRLKG